MRSVVWLPKLGAHPTLLTLLTLQTANDALQETLLARGPLLLRVAFALLHLGNGSQRSGSFGMQDALYSNPFAFRTVWAAGEERNVTSALAASV
jgi:hypothetical protein